MVNRLLKPKPMPTRRYVSPNIPLAVIRRFARQVAEYFRPHKIILFGSYAYGTPHQDSDVDLLVIMPARNAHTQAARIRLALPAPFPMDLLVRTPATLRWRLAAGDSFLGEVMAKGKVLYEEADRRVGSQGRGRSPRRHPSGAQRSPRP
jgi:predicted nucleotidyltransferase